MLSSNQQLKLGALLSYVSIGLNILVGLLCTPWIIQQIGQEQYGLYTLATSLITLFLMDFGLSSATARYVSKLHAEEDERGVGNLLGAIYKLYLLIDAVIFLALIVVFFQLDAIYVNLTPEELGQFKVVYAISAGFSIINFPFVTLNGILTAYEKFVQMKLADVLYRLLLVVLIVMALTAGYGLYGLVTVNAVAGLAVVVYKLVVIHHSTTARVNFHHTKQSLYRDILGFSAWSTVAALSQRLIFTITPSILGIVSNSKMIAVFGIVTLVEGYVHTITTAFNGMFMPRISRIYTDDDSSSSLMTLLMNVGRFQYALNGLIIAGFVVLGKDFILLWMGEDFLDAYYGIVLVIIPGIFFNSMQIAQTAIVVTKHVDAFARVNVLTGLINVVLSVFLAASYGAVGACISIFVAYMFRSCVLLGVYQKKLKIDLIYFAKHCFLRMSPPIVLTILVGTWFNREVGSISWIWFGVQGILVMAFYLTALYFTGLEKRRETIHSLWSFLKSK